MDEPHEGVLYSGSNLGRSCMLSRLDDVGAGVRLRARFADLADEDVNSAEGTRYPYSIEPASGPQPASLM